MRKIFLSFLPLWAVSAVAQQNNLLQEFDNQVSIGYGMQQVTSGFGTANIVPTGSWLYSNSNVLNFEGERLLNNGIWFDVNANMTFGVGPVGTTNSTLGTSGISYQSSNYGLNGKFGYGFAAANQHFQVIPYVALGMNNYSSVIEYTPSTPAYANSFAYLGGVGARVEYRINRSIMIFGDQLIGYNWDQSGPINGVQPQNSWQLTTRLGAKFNLAEYFQVGVQGIYSNFQPQTSNYSPNGYMAQQQSSLGGLVSLGLTY